MNNSYSSYPIAKDYFLKFSNHSANVISNEARSIMFSYEDIKTQKGDFIAARFLIDVYKLLTCNSISTPISSF